MAPWVHRLFLSLLLLATAGCSAYAPEVLGIESGELRRYAAEGVRREELFLDLEVADRDGFAELDRLYVIHDEAELFWDISSQQWVASPEEGVLRLRSLAAESLPRGSYRVELYDLGGRSGEGSFTLPLLPSTELLEEHESELLTLAASVERLLELREPAEVASLLTTLVFLPSGGGESEVVLPPGDLSRALSQRALLTDSLAPFRGRSGSFALYSRAGDLGPAYLYELPDLSVGSAPGE